MFTEEFLLFLSLTPKEILFFVYWTFCDELICVAFNDCALGLLAPSKLASCLEHELVASYRFESLRVCHVSVLLVSRRVGDGMLGSRRLLAALLT